MLRRNALILAGAFALLCAAGTSPAQEAPPETEILPATAPAGHVPPGAPYDYGTPFPTSGPHDPVPTAPGLYTQVQPATQLVHALEHGNVVIYYDQPGEAVTTRLLELTQAHPEEGKGIVVAPSPGMGERIVLTAWERRLVLERYDEEKAAAFIAAFLGKGPDHPAQ